MSIIDEIKESFRKGTTLHKLIYLNLGLFLAVQIVKIVLLLSNSNNLFPDFLNYLAVPANLEVLARRPWTLITYMFLHEGFIHILFNLLWLYWFGTVFIQELGLKKLLSTYLLGGLTRGILYVVFYNVFPVFAGVKEGSIALGASASVMAVVFAISFYVPNYQLPLMFIGNIKLKYIAVFTIVLDVLSIPAGNAGGHIAHIGGALFGIYFISQYKKGKLISKGFEKWLDKFFTFFKRNPKMKVTYKKTGNKDYDYKNKKAAEQKEMDKILEKISKSGYSSLSKEEKELLFKMGQK